MVVRRWYGVLATVMVLALLLVACAPAGQEEGQATTAPTIAPTVAAEATTPPAVEEETPAVETMTPEAEETEVATVEATEEPTEEATAAPEETMTPAAMAGEIDCFGAEDSEVNVLYQWSGTEAEAFTGILQPLIDACGLQVVAQTSRDAAVLDTRVQSDPPDVVFWPTIAPLNLYTDMLIPLDTLGADSSNYADFWVEMGTVDDEWLTVPVKADIKTIIWYSPAQFELNGYEVPETWEDLEALVEQMVEDGNTPWAMGLESEAATGWTGSDFIQDILLVQQGPEYVNDIMTGDVLYNDEGVAQAYETYGMWAMDEQYTVGGAQGTVSTPFLEAIYQVFSDPPEAMMVKQSGFAGSEVVAQFPDLQYGEDFDFFQVPDAQGLQGGADFLFAFSDSPAAQAMVAYLTSETGAVTWAEAGFDLSPHMAALGNYENPALAKRAEILSEAEGFTPDIGDTIPAPFGEAEWRAIVEYVNGADLQDSLDQAAEVQQDALGLQ